VDLAEQMLLDNLKWREENSLDTIHEEDWSEFEKVYRYAIEGCDKVGRPGTVASPNELLPLNAKIS